MFAQAVPDLKWRFLWLIIGYALVILVVYLSLTSDPVDMGMSFAYVDKLYHALAYFTLTTWFSQIYHNRSQRYAMALVFVVMSVLLEYLQSFEPGRFAEFGDMLANLTGVILGFCVALTRVSRYLLKMEKYLIDRLS